MNRQRADYEGSEEAYFWRNREYYMTSFERRAEHLGAMREKARHRLQEPDGDSCKWARDWLRQYEQQTDDEIEKAIGLSLESLRAFQDSVTARIRARFDSGDLAPLRCPACARIAFTPETRQCIWCGHNWRDASQARVS